MRSRASLFALIFFLAAPLSAQTFVFDLRGSQEVPPVPSTASGGCMGQLDQVAATFSLTCVHDVVGATVMHIHRAPAGENGPIAFDLGDPASPVTATWTSMTPSDITALLEGELYLNVHTAGRPAGEIRGQIVNGVDEVSFTADGAQAVPPSETSATASCTADLNSGATSLAIDCTHNLAGADAAHVHDAPFGQNGPIVFTFPSAASPLNANIPMTPLLVAKYAATFLYLDVHTPGGTEEEPSDAIRGQIGTPPAGATSGTIVIAKNSYPSGATGFSFTDDIEAPNNFVLDDGETRTFLNVAPGTYTVTEDDPSEGNFTLGDVSCDDADSTGDTRTRTASITVDAGETVVCRFRNLETAPTDDIFVFHLSGDQEVPPVVTPERGGCMGRFDAGTSSLTLICTHDVDLPTVMHIHRGAPGAIGDIVFDMGPPDSPVIATWSGMTPAQVADLKAGNYYVNIHTSGRPAGAIRGQIVLRTVDTISYTMDAAQVVPPDETAPYTGNCTANLDDPATGLAVACTHDLPAPDLAHVHRAPRGQNGPIVFTFPSAASPFAATVPMTPRDVADFAAGFLYTDVHGPEAGETGTANEIRGQIAAPVVVPTTGTIRIVKATSPAGGTGFTFTENIPGPASTFTLDDAEEQTFADVPAGTYTVTENPSATHSLAGISCGDADSTANPFARTATINLQAGEVVTCTFTNLQNVASPQRFVFHLSADQEVPPGDSSARGGCFAQFDGTDELSIVCSHDASSPTIAHIHYGAAGANGDIAFDLGDPLSPIVATWSGMTPADVAALLAGNLYVNIHASGRPAGEIRGQILPRTVDNFRFFATGAQEVPPTDSTATGDCTADLANDASSVFVRCEHGVDSPSMTHLHSAPPGADGPIVFHFPNTNPFQANVPLTPRLVADFAAGFLYVNIHSLPDYEQGEIRGQLIDGSAPAHLQHVPTASEWALILMTLALAAMAWWKMRM
jgi:hypothetical protein